MIKYIVTHEAGAPFVNMRMARKTHDEDMAFSQLPRGKTYPRGMPLEIGKVFESADVSYGFLTGGKPIRVTLRDGATVYAEPVVAPTTTVAAPDLSAAAPVTRAEWDALVARVDALDGGGGLQE